MRAHRTPRRGLLLAAALAAAGCAGARDAPAMRGGVLDLSAWDFEARGAVALAGEWQICWGELVAPDAEACPGGAWQSFPVPRLWSDAGVPSPIGGKGVATYRAVLLVPPDAGDLTLSVGAPLTAHRLWIDGEERGGSGTVGLSPSTTVATLENHLVTLPHGAARIELLVHVANFEFRGGGLRRSWTVGLDEQVRTQNGYELLLYAGFSIASLVIGLVFLAQFAFRPSERARGWFGLCCVLIGLRILPASSGDLYQLAMGWASFSLLIRLEYLNTALLIAVGLAYLRDKIPGVMPPRLAQLLMLAALALAPIHAFAPLDTVLATLPVLLVLPPLVLALAIASYARAARRGRPGAASTLAVALAFTVGVVHDVVRTATGVGAPIELFPYFVVAFVASEAHSLLRSFARSFATAEKLSQELQDSNFELQETEEAVVRFVPFDFLRALGKRSVRDVAAGDHVTAEMTVLHCGVPVLKRGFAEVNALLGRLEAEVRAHGGFVIQQLGDGFVALFAKRPGDAIEAALGIRRAIAEDSPAEAAAGSMAVATGPVTLGTVGNRESLAAVFTGPPVDLARELQERARRSHGGLLISDATRRALGEGDAAALREAGVLDVAGQPVPVFELPFAP